MGKRVVIAGGISVNDPNQHDGFPYNFINPAVRWAKKLKTDVHLFFYTPSYERRVNDQKHEHAVVQNPKKNKQHFANVMDAAARSNKFTLIKIQSAKDLTDGLNKLGSIESIDYFGHSNDRAMFLEYGSVTPAESTDYWGMGQALNISRSVIARGAVFRSYGCNQADEGGLCGFLRTLWQIRTVGSRGKTDFEAIGDGSTIFPLSQNGYYEYPVPVKDAAGMEILPPARKLTYYQLEPPH